MTEQDPKELGHTLRKITMQQTYRHILIFIALSINSAWSIAETTIVPTTVATTVVNGAAISNQKIDFLVKQAIAAGQQDTPELRSSIRENLITSLILFQEAQKQGLENDVEVLTSLELSRQSILARAVIQKYLKDNPMTDERLQVVYEKMKPQVTRKEVKTRHILVKTQDQAARIMTALKSGKRFEDLASKSIDPGSKDRGGDLGWSNPNSYVAEFSDALKKLEKGQLASSPVKTQYGFHVIQKMDEREGVTPMSQLKPQLIRDFESEAVEAYVKALRDKAVIN